MIVSSFFPGRIRLREAVFKDPVIVEKCLKILTSSELVSNVQNNFTTGSILLEYDPAKIPMDKLQPLVPFFLELEKLARNYTGKNQDVMLKKLNELEGILEKLK